MARFIIILVALLSLAFAQQEFPLFAKSDLMGADGIVIPQTNPGFIGQNDKYLFFWVPINESQGTIIFYARNDDGQYSEVNRIMGQRMGGYSLAGNNEWFVSYNGANRKVIFWKMDANHQMVNNFTWAYTQMDGFANSIHLLSNNNMVALANIGGGYKLVIFPFANNNWAVTPSAMVPADPWASYTVSETSAATYDQARKIVTIYSIGGNTFHFIENVTVPFTFESTSVPWTYNNVDTIVFVLSSTKIGVLERQQIDNTTIWNATTFVRKYESDYYYNTHFLWRGSDLYFASEYSLRNTNITNDSPKGSLYKFSKLDNSTWNITEIYSTAKDISPGPGFVTTHFWGFAVTDRAVYSLSVARNRTKSNVNGFAQLLYVPTCYNDAIALTCRDKSYLSCSPVNIDVAELYSIDDDCADVSVNGSASIAVTFDGNNSFKTTISVSRFEQTAQCDVTVLCNVEPVASNPPSNSNTPGSNNTPGNNNNPSIRSPDGSLQISAATIRVASLLTAVLFVGLF